MRIAIIPYEEGHHPAFRAINLTWLEHYNLKESHDLLILNDPRSAILSRGGYIWVAVADEEVIGSIALMKEHEGVYEIGKMSVVQTYQGKGIAKMLLDTLIQKATELKARKIVLFSNHQLTRAIALYKHYGFRHVEVLNSPFETADVKMELNLIVKN